MGKNIEPVKQSLTKGAGMISFLQVTVRGGITSNICLDGWSSRPLKFVSAEHARERSGSRGELSDLSRKIVCLPPRFESAQAPLTAPVKEPFYVQTIRRRLIGGMAGS